MVEGETNISGSSLACPECGSGRVWKDGYRYNNGEPTQRWLCRNCGFRFSEHLSQNQIEINVLSKQNPILHSTLNLHDRRVVSRRLSLDETLQGPPLTLTEDVEFHNLTSVGKQLNTLPSKYSNAEYASQKSEAKNLAIVNEARLEKAAGATLDIKGMLANFLAKSELAGYDKRTIQIRLNALMLLANRRANLLDPENVFKAIDNAKRYDPKTREILGEWKNGTKNNAAQAYKSFCEINNITISKGINFNKWVEQSQKLPWLPLEAEIDALIAGCSRTMSTFLQVLKETGMRSGEAWRLTWADVDLEHNIITLNATEKLGIPRQCKISNKLVAMLNSLPKTDEKIFGKSSLTVFRTNFTAQRKRVAFKLQNPRIKRITMHTLRHWKASMEYHKTRDILHVQQLLGHRNIQSTMIYTHLVNFESDEWHVAHAKTLKEEDELVKAGFELVRYNEQEQVAIYRKRK